METDINLNSCTYIQTVESFQDVKILKKEVLKNESVLEQKLKG